MLIVRVVVGGRERRRNVGPGKGATGFDPVARRFVGIGHVAEGRDALLVRQARQFRRRIVRVSDTVRVRQRETGSPPSNVIGNCGRNLGSLLSDVIVPIPASGRKLGFEVSVVPFLPTMGMDFTQFGS